MPVDTSEKCLETRIFSLLLESGWLPGDRQDYIAASCVDLAHLAAFLQDTQPETAQAFSLDSDNNTRRQLLNRLKREIANHGIIDVLRKGIEHGPTPYASSTAPPPRVTRWPQSSTPRTASP